MCGFETLTRPLRAEGKGGKRASKEGTGQGMTVFNDLLSRYKLFWPRPPVFGRSQ